uniref:VWA domain-containing protein n=1 Tax=Desulfobacca acetoxidans TaxID=60893 RepID=A0A7C5EPP4_9BACT
MHRPKVSRRMVCQLFLACFWAWSWTFLAWAQEEPRIKLVLAVDPGTGEGNPARAVELLLQLLGEDTHLGLTLIGVQDRVVIPAASLNQEQRDRIWRAWSKTSQSQGKVFRPLKEEIDLALGALRPEKSGRQVCFFLCGKGNRQSSGGEASAAGDPQPPPELVSQLKAAGVVCYAALAPQAPGREAYEGLALATGGRFWTIQENFPWHLAALKVFQYLQAPQEAQVKEGRFLLDSRVEEAVLVATRAVAEKSVVLTSPSGSRLTPFTRAPTVKWRAGPDYDLITIIRPRPGIWTLEQARPEGTRVFLKTSLTLGVKEIPREVAADEVLPVTLFLRNRRGDTPILVPGERLSFGGELAIAVPHPARAEFRASFPSLNTPTNPSEISQTGLFLPLNHSGEGEMCLWAQGRDFQRQVVFPLTVSPPWYSAQWGEKGKDEKAAVSFQPGVRASSVTLEGTLQVKSPEGAVAGSFVRPAPNPKIRLGSPPPRPGVYQVELELQGTLPEGRTLYISPAPARLEVPSRPKPEPEGREAPQLGAEAVRASPKAPGGAAKSRKKRLWLGLSLAGLATFGVAVYFILRDRFPKAGSEGEEKNPEGDTHLRDKAQVEILLKEKQELQKALEEKDTQIKGLMAEKAELQEELKRLREKSLISAKTLEELERKLQEAEKEAEAVQSEYMALYARSQENKQALKKN